MSQPTSPRTLLQDRMRPYWEPDDEHHFGNLQNLINRCEKNVSLEKKNFEAVDTPIPELIALYRKVLKDYVGMIRKVEGVLNDAADICTKGLPIARSNNDQFRGDYSFFAERLGRLRSDISKVYRNALYPLLLSIQNAESGWHPGSIVCKAWDLYTIWNAPDPEAIIDQEFPKK